MIKNTARFLFAMLFTIFSWAATSAAQQSPAPASPKPKNHVGEGDRDGAEDDHRAGVALPRLFLFGARTEHPIDRALDEAEEVHAAVKDGRHVRAKGAPGQAQRHPEGEDGEEETHLELLRLEHGVADVKEHDDGDAKEDYLGETHTRSSAQMSPSITAAKPIMPSAVYRSAMTPVSLKRP